MRRGTRRAATVIALAGELGSGKTTFVQGFARAVGARSRAVSPTFVLMRRMRIGAKHTALCAEGRGSGGASAKKALLATDQASFINLYHIDAYRLSGAKAARALGLREIFADPRNLVLIEWPERIHRALPRSIIRIRFSHGTKLNERRILFRALAP